MMKRAVAIAVTLSLLPVVVAAKPKKDKSQVHVTIDQEGLEGRPQPVSSAWMGYGLARATWVAQNVIEKPEVPRPYRRSFEEELAGREGLTKIWSELKQSDATAVDPYLDALARVLESGFLREYVWVFLKSDDWAAAPEGLRLGELEAWKAANLAGHKVETYADVTVVPKKK